MIIFQVREHLKGGILGYQQPNLIRRGKALRVEQRLSSHLRPFLLTSPVYPVLRKVPMKASNRSREYPRAILITKGGKILFLLSVLSACMSLNIRFAPKLYFLSSVGNSIEISPGWINGKLRRLDFPSKCSPDLSKRKGITRGRKYGWM